MKKHCSESQGKLRKKIVVIEKSIKTLTRSPDLDMDNPESEGSILGKRASKPEANTGQG